MSNGISAAIFTPIATIIRYEETHVGKFLRTIGELQEHFILDERLVIKDAESGSTLVIDSKLIEPFPFRQRVLYQFIGEVRLEPQGQVILRAYVYRCVEGLDLKLYEQSHEFRLRSLRDIA